MSGGPIQRSVKLTDPYDDSGRGTEVTVFGGVSLLEGRAMIELCLGQVAVHLRPTVAELRALAAALIEAADKVEVAT